MSSEFLFVYGTLKRGEANHLVLEGHAEVSFLAKGYVAGTLYDLGPFPGLILSKQAAWVSGEVFQLQNLELLEGLDRFELYQPGDPASSLFIKRRTGIILEASGTVQGWVYEYNGKIDEGKKIQRWPAL